MALAVASTVVLIRVLADHRDLHTPTGHIAVGWLVVEDLFTVLALVLLPVLFAGRRLGIQHRRRARHHGGQGRGSWSASPSSVGTRVIPCVLDHVADTGSRELFTLTVLTLALGHRGRLGRRVRRVDGARRVSRGACRRAIRLQPARRVRRAADARRVCRAVLRRRRHAAVAGYLLEAPGLILATLAVVMIGKPLVALVIVRMLGYPFKVALAIAVALAQIGEFSFILSSLGRELDILPPEATNTLVAASIVSIVLNPILYRAVPRIEQVGRRTSAAVEVPESAASR